jgi:uncharacterized lipoprotein YajG
MVTPNVYSINFIEKFKQKLLMSFVYAATAFVMLAFLTQVTFLILTALGKDEIIQKAVSAFNLKFDGTFKNHPGNVMYDADEHVWVESVTNNVKIGKLAGNRQLEFGVKNVLEEYLQEKGLDLTPSAPNKLAVQIVYLDVLTTKKNVSVFHKNEEEVVIRMKGTLMKDGKKVKEVMVEESSSEISMSTLIVDEGGKFNQTSLSNALKKGCDKLITKLLGGK